VGCAIVTNYAIGEVADRHPVDVGCWIRGTAGSGAPQQPRAWDVGGNAAVNIRCGYVHEHDQLIRGKQHSSAKDAGHVNCASARCGAAIASSSLYAISRAHTLTIIRGGTYQYIESGPNIYR
jgi:hypothetical protein